MSTRLKFSSNGSAQRSCSKISNRFGSTRNTISCRSRYAGNWMGPIPTETGTDSFLSRSAPAETCPEESIRFSAEGRDVSMYNLDGCGFGKMLAHPLKLRANNPTSVKCKQSRHFSSRASG